MQYEREKKKVGVPEGRQNALKNNVRKNHTLNTEKPQRTCERLAEKYKLNPDTIRQDAKFAKAVDESDILKLNMYRVILLVCNFYLYYNI